jgi:ribosomal protein S18 acetylase RimI-like enzyme
VTARRNEVSIRIAAPSEAATISDLLFEFNGEALPAEDLAARMDEARGLETVFLGDLDGELAALLVLRIAPTIFDAEDWAEITELYVQPCARRRGLGRMLVEAAVAYSQDRGCSEMHLLVDPENRAGLSFYRALGFCRDSWETRRQL